MVYILVLIGLFYLYILFFRPYVLARRRFKCLRCGNCCRLSVTLEDSEIRLLEKNGYKDFLDERGFIRKKEGFCQFLKFKDGKTYCSIESIKPRICKRFPLKKGPLGKKIDTRCKYFYLKLG
jgi:Fe-S-cluster containining protein